MWDIFNVNTKHWPWIFHSRSMIGSIHCNIIPLFQRKCNKIKHKTQNRQVKGKYNWDKWINSEEVCYTHIHDKLEPIWYTCDIRLCSTATAIKIGNSANIHQIVRTIFCEIWTIPNEPKQIRNYVIVITEYQYQNHSHFVSY